MTYQTWRRHRSCTRKIRYPSPWVAANAATLHAWAGRAGMQAYGCDWCGGWHIGHPGRKEKAA